jgi:phosphoserine phosphatase
MHSLLRRSLFAALSLVSLSRCENGQSPLPDLGKPACVSLDAAQTWYGSNRDKLDQLLRTQGACSATYDASKKPLAVFDWDNTVIKNDVGDATFFYMLAHDQIVQPPGKNWRFTSRYITGDAVSALDAACGSAAPAGAPLPTSTNMACGREILSIYVDGKTSGGKAAFSGWDYRRMEPAYAWLAQLLAGYSQAQVRGFAALAKTENLANAVDSKGTIAGVQVTAWARIYEPMRDLIGKLQQGGFDVWVVSASPQPIVEVWASEVGIAGDHVIGIRNVERGGKYSADLQGCGDVADGTNDGSGNATGNSLITYIDGKRCWINKVIFGDSTKTALQRSPDARQRPVFAAGDSDTDITFLQDATGLKLAINRNKKELMCNAFANAGGSWIVNPMFIQPRPQQTTPYPCSTSACKDAAGASVPCRDENGALIADQADSVF